MNALDEWVAFFEAHRLEIAEGINRKLRIANYMEDCFSKGVVPSVRKAMQLVSRIKLKPVNSIIDLSYGLPREVREFTDDPLSSKRVNLYHDAHSDWRNGRFIDAYTKFKLLNELPDIKLSYTSCNSPGFNFMSAGNTFAREMIEVLEDMIAPDVRVENDKLIVEKKPASVVAIGKHLIKGIRPQVTYQVPVKTGYVKPFYLDELKGVLSIEDVGLMPLTEKESSMSWDEHFSKVERGKEIALGEELSAVSTNDLILKLKQDIVSYERERNELVSNIASLKEEATLDGSLIECGDESIAGLDYKVRQFEVIINKMAYLRDVAPKQAVKLSELFNCIKKQDSELSIHASEQYKESGVSKSVSDLWCIDDTKELIDISGNKTFLEFAYSRAGCRYKELNEFGKALDCFKKALNFDPVHVNHWGNIGNLYHDRGYSFYKKGLIKESASCFKEALKHYEEGVKLEPKYNGGMWFRMANIYSAFNEHKNVVRCYEKMIENYAEDFIKDNKIVEKLEESKKLSQ